MEGVAFVQTTGSLPPSSLGNQNQEPSMEKVNETRWQSSQRVKCEDKVTKSVTVDATVA